jgi:putative dehydrogenase
MAAASTSTRTAKQKSTGKAAGKTTGKTTGTSASTKASKATRKSAARPAAVGFIGLGIMGSAMSANLIKAGFEVFGYDPVAAARTRLRKAGGTPCESAADVARHCGRIVLSLPSEGALDSIAAELVGAGISDRLLAECSTLPEPAKLRARDTLQATGITLLDCPLSGTGAQALTRDLAVYASGDAAAIAEFGPVFDGFARIRYDVGGFGNGIRMKLVANLLVAIHNVSTAEAILLGERSGLDAAQIVRVVADGAGGSRMFQVRGPVMVKRNWDEATMKVGIWQKDMRLIQEALQRTNTPAPLFCASMPIYNAAMALGHGDDDTAAVYSVLEQMAGGANAGSKPAAKRIKRS